MSKHSRPFPSPHTPCWSFDAVTDNSPPPDVRSAPARTVSGARTYLIGGGAIYLILWLYGLVVGQDSSANFVPLNPADDWLHLFLGLGMIALGLLTTRRAVTRP